MATLQANGPERMFQNLGYRYDNVGNILGLQNQVAVPPANSYGGPTAQSFTYDDLYRLTQARGTFDFAPNKQDRYSLDLSYDSIHNITGKQQLHEVVVPGGQSIPQKKTSYNWIYDYSSSHPHAPTHLGERAYRYDANGNQTGWDHDRNGTRRNIVWDEDNRIQSVFDNGHEKTYKYDDQGERVIKRGPQGETAYINQWFTVRNREVASKHVWAGTTRIATGLMPGVKALPRTRGKGTPGGPNAVPQENFLYFYHPDHLGSSSYVTDSNGKVYQHLEYFPFGETWVEESSNTQRTPYLFTAKELDEETGLYYFGARYYDPRTSVWQSPDPILEKYLGSNRSKLTNGGVFNPVTLSLYTYSYQNPIKFKDPDGRDCTSADETTTCVPMKDGVPVPGLPTISFPTPKGYPSKMNAKEYSIRHHEYIYRRPIGNKSPDSVRQSVVNDPTPNDSDKPATPKGTPNDATPSTGLRGLAANLVNNDVISYSFKDKDGIQWEINVTEPSHTLFPGYVLRGVVGNELITYGEGTGRKQMFGPLSDATINDVWIDQNAKNIRDAKDIREVNP